MADLPGTLRRFEASGVRAVPMAGQVRLMTHADLTDADISAALSRIGPVVPSRPSDAAAARTLRRPGDRAATPSTGRGA